MKYTLINTCLMLCLIAAGCGNRADGDRALHAEWFEVGPTESLDEPLITGWYRVVDSGELTVRRTLGDSVYHVDPFPIVTVDQFKTIKTEYLPHADTIWQVVTHLDAEGGRLFAEATEAMIGKDLVFVLDDSLVIEPIRIQARIASGVLVISRKESFTEPEAEELAYRIIVSKDNLPYEIQ